ncbi:type VI secretion system Vgr family protein [Trinickia mobilis]|uniref:type VI secretion system Vgr family protein n=1 Tax=Trinickia mobilis TaxID=2816356 RepID=UPI001A8CD1A5|nr:type VI secretion system Vgr family protein [Trinickia mobilis]
MTQNPLFDAARTLSVSGAALPMDAGQSLFTPVRLTGTEALGELFEYTLELKTPDALAFSPSVAANLELDKLIGTEVTVSIEIEGNGHFIAGLTGDAGAANVGAGTREITGLVAAARLLRTEGRSVVYALTLRPWLWLATKNQDCRLFQDKSVVEITEEALARYSFRVEMRLSAPRPNDAYPKRDIQRQHWESDFAFLRRLWEEWGIYFWFEHRDGKHVLVLCDSIGAHQAHGEAYRTIRYAAPAAKRIDEEHIHALSVAHALTTGAVSSVDYDCTQPRADLSAIREDPRDTSFARQERYTWGDYSQPQAGSAGLAGVHNDPRTEAEYLVLVQMQAERCQGLRATGQGNLRGLTTGRTFELTHYQQEAANREYLVVSSTLDIQEIAEESGTIQRYRCDTKFEIQPTSEAFRLLRETTKPRTHGPETAIVVGPETQEIWTDAYGRVKVQFWWDRQGRKDERSSCWIRVSSPWQGSEFGATHLPRIGQEVIVDYLNGDPDLPIITGRVVNASQLPAWKLPENQALSGFRSRELGGGRANHLVMDDTHGKIQVQLSSDHACSQLNLGSIARIPGNAGRQDARGEGFELRTDGHGVVRAAQGMVVTTEARSDAQGHAKDLGETIQRLAQARDLHARLTGLAQQQAAQALRKDQDEVAKSIGAQNDAIRGGAKTGSDRFPEFTTPHLTLASPVGIQTTTAGSTHLASGEHLALTTGGHIGMAVGRSWFASVADRISLFVHKLGIKLIAASGKVRIEAQNDDIEVIAKRVVEIMSTTDWINLKAKQGVRINGGGSELEISEKGIFGFTDGPHVIHAADHQTPGPETRPQNFPSSSSEEMERAFPFSR